LAAALAAGACASTGGVPKPFPMPGARTRTARTPLPPFSNGPPPPGGRSVAGLDAYALTGTALALRGSPYRNGGADPNGFDCSGFTQYVFGQYGVSLPRDVQSQLNAGNPVKPADTAAGDLLFFSTVAPGASHVAIALGGDEFIHAPSSAGVVRVEHLRSSYWSRRFVAARRVAN